MIIKENKKRKNISSRENNRVAKLKMKMRERERDKSQRNSGTKENQQ
jgi:hypothetical protein